MPIQLKSMKIQMNETKIFLFSIFIRRYIFSVYLHLMNLHVNFENAWRHTRYYTFLFSYVLVFELKVDLRENIKYN